jgi:hypothetical protein
LPAPSAISPTTQPDGLRRFRPDAVVHLGEMPSASSSVMDVAEWTGARGRVKFVE